MRLLQNGACDPVSAGGQPDLPQEKGSRGQGGVNPHSEQRLMVHNFCKHQRLFA